MTTPREMAWRLYQAAAETARDAQIVADRALRDKEAAADLHDLLLELEQGLATGGVVSRATSEQIAASIGQGGCIIPLRSDR
jgi:hypothetical protein